MPEELITVHQAKPLTLTHWQNNTHTSDWNQSPHHLQDAFMDKPQCIPPCQRVISPVKLVCSAKWKWPLEAKSCTSIPTTHHSHLSQQDCKKQKTNKQKMVVAQWLHLIFYFKEGLQTFAKRLGQSANELNSLMSLFAVADSTGHRAACSLVILRLPSTKSLPN